MLNQVPPPSHPTTHRRRELPAVTDWQDFAEWCGKEGRQALPASDDTLTQYFQAKAQHAREASRHVDGLGRFALGAAVAGILVPIGAYLILMAKTGDATLSLQGALLLFGGFQLIALASSWTTRESVCGQAAWRMATLASLLVALSCWYFGEGASLDALKRLVVR